MIHGSNSARAGCALLTAMLLAGVSTQAMAASHKADPRDAQLQQLQAEVEQLMADRQTQQAKDAALAAKADALTAEVDSLKAEQATEIKTISATAAAIPAAPSVTASMVNGRPVLTSANGRFSATVHAIMQLDAAAYDQDAHGPIATDLRRSGPALGASATNVDLTHARQLKDGTDFRRARLAVDGTVFGDFDYRLMLDFAGSGVENTGQLYETWIQYNGLKPVKLRLGAFPPQIGLEDQTSTNGMPFMERSVVEDLARGMAAGDTRLAGQLFANGPHWLASGAVTGRTIGVLNTGTATAVPQTYDDQLGLVGRLAASPLYGSDWLVHFGVHGSYILHAANTGGPATTGATPLTDQVIAFANTQQLRVDGTKLINTGNIDAKHADTVGVEVAAQKGPFLLQSEYDSFGVDRDDPGISSPHFQGYYVEGLWSITGEPRKYNPATAAFDAPIPNHPFSWSERTWGAFEFGVRYSDMDLNYHAGAAGAAPGADAIRGGEEENISADLNWYLNPVVRFMLDFEHVRLDRLSPNAALYSTPVGAQIGQSYNAFGLRTQFSF